MSFETIETHAAPAGGRDASILAAAGRPCPRRSIPCGGHSFDEALRCRCGAGWWEHQRQPAPCPVDARGQNCRGAEAGCE